MYLSDVHYSLLCTLFTYLAALEKCPIYQGRLELVRRNGLRKRKIELPYCMKFCEGHLQEVLHCLAVPHNFLRLKTLLVPDYLQETIVLFDFLGFTQWDRLLKLYLSGPVHHTPNLMLFDCADVLGRTHPITEKAIKMCQDTYLVYPLPNLPTATAITSFFQRQQYCKYVQTWGG